MEWRLAGAAEQGRAIAAGQLDPVEQTEAYLEVAEASEDIYARLTPQRARDEAMAAHQRAKQGTRRGMLDGVALSWKDLFDTAGVATEAGTRLLAGRVPERDADVLIEATLGGSVCLGKTHMTELAFSGLGVNPMTATPPNIHDPELAPGGSSSGAALSVARGLAAAAVGSDTGGSVRIPAAWNDIVGLKTTHGRITTKGVVPLCRTFDTVGPITRNVEDAAHVLALLERRAAPDLRETSLKGKRLLVLEGLPFEGTREKPVQGFERAVEAFAKAGAVIERRGLPMVRPAMDLSGVLFAPEAYGEWKHEIEAAPEKMFAAILERFRSGRDALASDYAKGWHELAGYRAAYLEATAEYDAVLVPTSPILPPDVRRLLSDKAYFQEENVLALRNTRIGNVLGLCALNLPTGIPSCGISLMAPPMTEDRLLRLGMAAESSLA
ncbi:aspartyl-tRNA(Asn)/glutamyl-tRNA(Gln) amidotransferase subunit A [Thioclava sp. ES.031]|uniref:amidase n=1 Tax=Thioclava sp. ES.031 TaxID=1798203 RepID=UPI000BF9ECF5|nr:amidase family protein [Thioclava sp. ES.031]PFG64981.1 aspartyl-tRNA(Asn)/glutamyl-tRNA(Gln) amidotransferase subunit A [Thioclava sp. ES.031]